MSGLQVVSSYNSRNFLEGKRIFLTPFSMKKATLGVLFPLIYAMRISLGVKTHSRIFQLVRRVSGKSKPNQLKICSDIGTKIL